EARCFAMRRLTPILVLTSLVPPPGGQARRNSFHLALTFWPRQPCRACPLHQSRRSAPTGRGGYGQNPNICSQTWGKVCQKVWKSIENQGPKMTGPIQEVIESDESDRADTGAHSITRFLGPTRELIRGLGGAWPSRRIRH